jgi:hypothetical protein
MDNAQKTLLQMKTKLFYFIRCRPHNIRCHIISVVERASLSNLLIWHSINIMVDFDTKFEAGQTTLRNIISRKNIQMGAPSEGRLTP